MPYVREKRGSSLSRKYSLRWEIAYISIESLQDAYRMFYIPESYSMSFLERAILCWSTSSTIFNDIDIGLKRSKSDSERYGKKGLKSVAKCRQKQCIRRDPAWCLEGGWMARRGAESRLGARTGFGA